MVMRVRGYNKQSNKQHFGTSIIIHSSWRSRTNTLVVVFRPFIARVLSGYFGGEGCGSPNYRPHRSEYSNLNYKIVDNNFLFAVAGSVIAYSLLIRLSWNKTETFAKTIELCLLIFDVALKWWNPDFSFACSFLQCADLTTTPNVDWCGSHMWWLTDAERVVFRPACPSAEIASRRVITLRTTLTCSCPKLEAPVTVETPALWKRRASAVTTGYTTVGTRVQCPAI